MVVGKLADAGAIDAEYVLLVDENEVVVAIVVEMVAGVAVADVESVVAA